MGDRFVGGMWRARMGDARARRRLAGVLAVLVLVVWSPSSQARRAVVAVSAPDFIARGSVVRNMVDQVDDFAGSQIHVMYVLPFDGVDEQLDVNGTIATSLSAIQYWLSGQTGGRQLRLDTRAGEVDMTFVRLARTDAQIKAFGAFVRDEIQSDLGAGGYLQPGKVYLVYYGGGSTWACGGASWPPSLPGQVTALYLKGTPSGSPPCASNVLGGSATVPAYWEFAGLHEVMHTLGAAPACAAHHTLSGHVSDSPNDLMYAGASPWTPSILDIGQDDYYGHGAPGCFDFATSPFLGAAPANGHPGGTLYYFNDMESGAGGLSANAPWAITTESARSGTHAWSDSPGGPYGANANISIFSPFLNLASAAAPVLKFWQRRDIAAAPDAGNIWITTNNGQTWTNLATFRGTNPNWHETIIDLSAYAGFPSVRFTFQVASDAAGAGDGWYIDDIEVRDTTLVRNGGFGAGTTGWTVFGQPDNSYMVHSVVNGVFEFYRAPAPPGDPTQALVFQPTGLPLGAGEAIEAQFDMGNSSAVRKRFSVLLHDDDFSDLFVCTFWLQPFAPLRTYGIRTHSTEAWTNARISIYAATSGSDGGAYRLDNVVMRYAPSNPGDRTDCYDPTSPSAPGGAIGPETLTNGNFDLGSITGWIEAWNLQHVVTGGVVEMYRPAGPGPASVLFQPTNLGFPQGSVLTTQFDLGSVSAQRERVTVLLHDLDFTDLAACTFWLLPNQPLSTYTMRSFATKAWANATISIYLATTGTQPEIRLDNVSLRHAAGAPTHGSNCAEPAMGASAHGLRTR